MKNTVRKISALVLALLLTLSTLAISEECVGCPRMSSVCPMAASNESACADCDMAEICGSLPCAQHGLGACAVNMPMAYHYLLCDACTDVTGVDFYLCMSVCELCGMHVHAQESEHDCVPVELPCEQEDHIPYGILPLGYHYQLCDACTDVTGIDFYLCMSVCDACGMHTHAQETDHDCPLAS